MPAPSVSPLTDMTSGNTGSPTDSSTGTVKLGGKTDKALPPEDNNPHPTSLLTTGEENLYKDLLTPDQQSEYIKNMLIKAGMLDDVEEPEPEPDTYEEVLKTPQSVGISEVGSSEAQGALDEALQLAETIRQEEMGWYSIMEDLRGLYFDEQRKDTDKSIRRDYESRGLYQSTDMDIDRLDASNKLTAAEHYQSMQAQWEQRKWLNDMSMRLTEMGINSIDDAWSSVDAAGRDQISDTVAAYAKPEDPGPSRWIDMTPLEQAELREELGPGGLAKLPPEFWEGAMGMSR